LRVMLGKALCEAYKLPEDLLLDTYFLTRSAGILTTRLIHDGSSTDEDRHYRRLSQNKRKYRHKKVILLVRDVKDTLVSCYFQATRRVRKVRRYAGSISDFIRDERYGARKILSFYAAWFAKRHIPRGFLLVRYEDMHRDPHKILAQVLAFVGACRVEEQVVASAVEYSKFSRMKEMERSNRWDDDILRPGDEKDEESFKVRRGVVGGYREYLSEKDI
jgi:hypothetical protein